VLNNPVHDGVFINDRTMPGGTATSASYTFNLGIVTVHEVREIQQKHSVMPGPVQYAASTAVVGGVAHQNFGQSMQYSSRAKGGGLCLPIVCQSLANALSLEKRCKVGHWLGLLHVFAGGCDSSTGGDFVEDTRAAAAADYSCTPTNTCPNLSGTNPIHNFMGECSSALHINFVSSVRARARACDVSSASPDRGLNPRRRFLLWLLGAATFDGLSSASASLCPLAAKGGGMCVCKSTHAGHPFCCAFCRLHRRRVPHGVLRRPDCAHPEHVAAVPRELRLRRRRRIRQRHVAGAVQPGRAGGRPRRAGDRIGDADGGADRHHAAAAVKGRHAGAKSGHEEDHGQAHKEADK